MPALTAIFTAGWAGGINPWLVVVVMGLGGHLGADVPAFMLRTDVLIIAGILAVVEAAVDKIAMFDSLWDGISTVIRPVAAGVITALVADPGGDISTLVIGSAGGVVGLISHLSKAAIRAGINTSPEPVSNIVMSTVEDIAVALVTAAALIWPVAAASVAAILLAVGLGLGILGGAAAIAGARAVRARFKHKQSEKPDAP